MIPRKVLFCTDFSENSHAGGQWALDFAHAFGAGLIILHVINSSRLGFPAFESGVALDLQDLLDSIQESVGKAFEEELEKSRRVLSDVSAYSRTGVPAVEIVRFADEESVDLIVMGTHGWTGFKHLILGSTAENVVRTARCPVLTVKSTAV